MIILDFISLLVCPCVHLPIQSKIAGSDPLNKIKQQEETIIIVLKNDIPLKGFRHLDQYYVSLYTLYNIVLIFSDIYKIILYLIWHIERSQCQDVLYSITCRFHINDPTSQGD